MAAREAFCEGLKSPPVPHVLVDGADVALGSRQPRKLKSFTTKLKPRFCQEANDCMTSRHRVNLIFGRTFLLSHASASYKNAPCFFSFRLLSKNPIAVFIYLQWMFCFIVFPLLVQRQRIHRLRERTVTSFKITNQRNQPEIFIKLLGDRDGQGQHQTPSNLHRKPPWLPFSSPDTDSQRLQVSGGLN